jgi:hypothetical protein
MDVILPFVRDRRVAASDVFLSGTRYIYGLGSRARRASESIIPQARVRASSVRERIRARSRFDIIRIARRGYDRNPDAISTVILHHTGLTVSTYTPLPSQPTDADRSSHHRIDQIIGNFVVAPDGTIYYTRDVQFILNDAGRRFGIDIEFLGNFPNDETPPPPESDQRVTRAAIINTRQLLRHLKQPSVLPNLIHIHPHGLIRRGKFDVDPGPDIWVNVGEWAVRVLHMVADTTAGYLRSLRDSRGISPRLTNQSYRRRDIPD